MIKTQLILVLYNQNYAGIKMKQQNPVSDIVLVQRELENSDV